MKQLNTLSLGELIPAVSTNITQAQTIEYFRGAFLAPGLAFLDQKKLTLKHLVDWVKMNKTVFSIQTS